MAEKEKNSAVREGEGGKGGGKGCIYYVASDMHQGDGSSQDTFTKAHAERLEEEAADLLDKKEEGAKIILGGDIFDLWRWGRKPLTVHEKSVKTLAMLADLLLLGNHDAELGRLAGFTVAERAFLDGIYLSHGHEFDDLNGRWQWVGKAATKVATAAGKVSTGLEDWLTGIGTKIESSGKGRNSPDGQTDERGIEFASTWHDLWLLVLGHTHRAKVISLKHPLDANKPYLYANTGTWQKDGWLKIDTGAKKVSFWRL